MAYCERKTVSGEDDDGRTWSAECLMLDCLSNGTKYLCDESGKIASLDHEVYYEMYLPDGEQADSLW